MKTRSLPPLVSLFVAALVATLLTTLTTLTTTSGARAAEPSAATAGTVPSAVTSSVPSSLSGKVKPREDFPRLPRRCATPREKIPVSPVVCGINRFDRDRPTILLWGDSHSWMFIPALKQAISGRDTNLVAVMMGTCPPMDNQVDADDAVSACFRSNALGIDTARALKASGQPYRIVLAGSWQRYVHARKVGDRTSYVGKMAQAMRQGTPRLARTLRAIGAQVDVVGQVATVPARHRACPQGNLPYACKLARGKALPESYATRTYVRQALGRVLGSRRLIDVNPYFCTAQVCKGRIGSTRTWFDDLHLSASMSAKLAPYFARTVDAVSPPVVAQPEPPEPPTCTIPILCGLG